MSTSMGLTPGQQYRVTQPFLDFDRQQHPIGETWTFITTNFLPYDDGLTLHVLRNGLPAVYRLQWRPEEQANIIENFLTYVEPC